MDQNWFYSSLSQSAAAIIGLIGAVLGARLLHHITIIRESKRAILEDFLKVKESIKAAHNHVFEYLRFLEEDMPLNIKALQENGGKRTVNRGRSFFGSWAGGQQKDVVVTESDIATQEDDKKECVLSLVEI